jgi:hypothetical protein
MNEIGIDVVDLDAIEATANCASGDQPYNE